MAKILKTKDKSICQKGGVSIKIRAGIEIGETNGTSETIVEKVEFGSRTIGITLYIPPNKIKTIIIKNWLPSCVVVTIEPISAKIVEKRKKPTKKNKKK